MADHVPNATLREIPGAGHAAPLTHPEALADTQELDTSVASARRAYSGGIGPTYDEIAVNGHGALLVTSPGSRSLTMMWSVSEDTAVRIHGYDVDEDVVVRVAEGIHR